MRGHFAPIGSSGWIASPKTAALRQLTQQLSGDSFLYPRRPTGLNCICRGKDLICISRYALFQHAGDAPRSIPQPETASSPGEQQEREVPILGDIVSADTLPYQLTPIRKRRLPILGGFDTRGV